jgi:Flavodoxins
MADITLISGSTLGSAEYVAEHLAEKLDDAGFSSEILHGPMLEEVPTDGIWLIISSTHGAGDIPDNLQPLYDALREQKPDLSHVHFGAIGIGSREYDTFCGAIDKLEAELKACGAKQVSAKRSGSTYWNMKFRKIRLKFGWDRGIRCSEICKDRTFLCG